MTHVTYLEVNKDDVVEDGGMVGHVALEKLDLGDGDEVLHYEALVQTSNPCPLTPGASLLTAFTGHRTHEQVFNPFIGFETRSLFIT